MILISNRQWCYKLFYKHTFFHKKLCYIKHHKNIWDYTYYMTMCFLWLNYKNTSGISSILSKSSLLLIKITQWGQFSSKLLLQVELVPAEQLLIVLQLSSSLLISSSSSVSELDSSPLDLFWRSEVLVVFSLWQVEFPWLFKSAKERVTFRLGWLLLMIGASCPKYEPYGIVTVKSKLGWLDPFPMVVGEVGWPLESIYICKVLVFRVRENISPSVYTSNTKNNRYILLYPNYW